jgi:hypothetical protein
MKGRYSLEIKATERVWDVERASGTCSLGACILPPPTNSVEAKWSDKRDVADSLTHAQPKSNQRREIVMTRLISG